MGGSFLAIFLESSFLGSSFLGSSFLGSSFLGSSDATFCVSLLDEFFVGSPSPVGVFGVTASCVPFGSSVFGGLSAIGWTSGLAGGVSVVSVSADTSSFDEAPLMIAIVAIAANTVSAMPPSNNFVRRDNDDRCGCGCIATGMPYGVGGTWAVEVASRPGGCEAWIRSFARCEELWLRSLTLG